MNKISLINSDFLVITKTIFLLKQIYIDEIEGKRQTFIQGY